MAVPPDLVQKSYDSHKKCFDDTLENRQDIAESWFREDTVDAWRHRRIHDHIAPLLAPGSSSTWLTIGDGRFGNDAHYILSKTTAEVMATDITDRLLKISSQKGFIKAYQQENAEALSFKNDSFDYLLCKESFHHFPRPFVALYEMIRVAKKGIIMIEPNDNYVHHHPVTFLCKYAIEKLRRILGKKDIKHGFEEVGNYVYRLSEHELEKIACSMGMRLVAFKGLNDYYLPGVEKEKASTSSILLKKIRRKIRFSDFLCGLKIKSFVMLCAIMFKTEPHPEIRAGLKKMGYRFVSLPPNPYAP